MMTRARRSALPWARLRRFLDSRQSVTLHEAAMLLRCEPSTIRNQLDDVEVPDPEERIPWTVMAELVRRTLTPGELAAAGRRTRGFPQLLGVTTVRWRLPAYLLTALERAVAEERETEGAERLTVEAYVTRQLEDFMEPGVMTALCADPQFREAFTFPEGE